MSLTRDYLKPYQREAAARAVEQQRLALLLAPGDGKTIVALTALVDAHALPALVVAPALVVETDVWGEEARRWEHTAGLHVVNVTGTPEQRLHALWEPAHVFIVSYENLMWLTDEVDLGETFAAIILDELSKMKAAGTKRFKRMRSRSPMSIRFRLGLTGSPVGNHLLDLWGELFMVAGKKALGPTAGGYREEYFEPYDRYGRVWGLHGMKRRPAKRGEPLRLLATPTSRKLERAIYKRVKPWVYARPDAERTDVPPVHEVARRLPLPADVERMLHELRSQLWTRLPSGAELEALAGSVAAVKARQLAGGAVYRPADPDEDEGHGGDPWEPEDEGLVPPGTLSEPDEWEAVHDVKVRAVRELVDELQGEPLLVFYWFKHERVRLLEMLRGRRVALLDGAESARAWNAREVDVLLAHPQSGGMGLNLQAGGHHVAWYTLPWPRWQYDQGCGRLARLGQTASEVTSHLLLCGPVDEDVAEVLGTKGATERRFMKAMR